MDPSWLPPAPRFFVFIFQIQYTLCPHLSKHVKMASGSALAVCTPTCQASPCWSCSLLKAGNQTLTALGTMRFGSTAKVLLKCKLKYYKISECLALTQCISVGPGNGWSKMQVLHLLLVMSCLLTNCRGLRVESVASMWQAHGSCFFKLCFTRSICVPSAAVHTSMRVQDWVAGSAAGSHAGPGMLQQRLP